MLHRRKKLIFIRYCMHKKVPFLFFFHFFYVWLEFYRQAQFNIIARSVNPIFYYSPALGHTSHNCVHTNSFRRRSTGYLCLSAQTRQTCAACYLFYRPRNDGRLSQSFHHRSSNPKTLDYESSDLTTTTTFVKVS